MNRQGKGKIEYCTHTWSPVTGCLHGCPYCFARRIAERFKGKAFPNGFKPTFHPERLQEPLKLKKPARIFVCDMGDLFGDWVSQEWIDSVLETVRACPQHTFLFLTKNPKGYRGLEFPENCWCGTTVEDQEAADTRIPELLKVKAAVRWVSVEPMLSRIDLTEIPVPFEIDSRGFHINALTDQDDEHFYNEHPKIDWVVCGGESGPGARPCHPDWIRSLRDQCQAAGVNYFFKQHGEWVPFYDRDKDDPDWQNIPEEKLGVCRLNLAGGHGFHGERVVYFRRVGKKAAGRLLDGVEWSEIPGVIES